MVEYQDGCRRGTRGAWRAGQYIRSCCRMKDDSNAESYGIGLGLEKNVTYSPGMIVAKSKKHILQRKISI
jgi:hypothetical protein